MVQTQKRKWYDWLKQVTSPEKKELAHVCSDGRQLWASDGYSLHVRQIATGKQGEENFWKPELSDQ